MSENTFLYWFHKWEREYIVVGMEAPFCCYRKRAYVLKGALSFSQLELVSLVTSYCDVGQK